MTQGAAPRRRSVVIPILLIALGAILLYSNWQPAFDPWPVIETYWPLLLVLVGLGMFGATFGVLAFLAVLSVLLWRGHNFSQALASHAGSTYSHHETRSVELQGAKFVRASIQMPSGELTVSGGAGHLLEADFLHSSSWEAPSVDYAVTGGTGDLEVRQNGGGTHFRGSDNHWNLRLGNGVPVELSINMGAGQGNLHLRDVELTNLDLSVGAGEVNVDLTGARKSDLNAEIKGGIGQANIRLPRDVGVVVNAHGGIGTIDAHGLKHEDGEYTNDAYGKSRATIHLNVNGGIGAIRLTQEP
jgi:hypothetical protein